jgi:hypothetical protein
VRWRLADVLIAQERFDDAKIQLDAARFGFDELLGRHILAFADHAAEFYSGIGNDCRRTLELARTNAANRPTRRAIRQVQTIAVSAGEAAAAGDLYEKRKLEYHPPRGRRIPGNHDEPKWLFVFNSNFLRMNQDDRSARRKR